MSRTQWLGLVIGVAGLTVAVLAVLDPNNHFRLEAAVFSTIAAAAGGALLCTTKFLTAGIVGGVLAAAGVVAAAWFGRDFVDGFPSRYTVMLFVVGGSLPGLVVAGLLVLATRPKSPPAAF